MKDLESHDPALVLQIVRAFVEEVDGIALLKWAEAAYAREGTSYEEIRSAAVDSLLAELEGETR